VLKDLERKGELKGPSLAQAQGTTLKLRMECPWVAARAIRTRPGLRGYRVDGGFGRALRYGALQCTDSELGR